MYRYTCPVLYQLLPHNIYVCVVKDVIVVGDHPVSFAGAVRRVPARDGGVAGRA